MKVLNADGTLSEAYRAFFEKYRAYLSQDFETSLIWHQLLSFRWLNSALAARTLAEILGERLYGTARLQDISAREEAGDRPGLIINTTLYNNGRRLVDHHATGGLHLRFLRGSGAIGPGARASATGGAENPRALDPSAPDDADRDRHRSMSGRSGHVRTIWPAR